MSALHADLMAAATRGDRPGTELATFDAELPAPVAPAAAYAKAVEAIETSKYRLGLVTEGRYLPGKIIDGDGNAAKDPDRKRVSINNVDGDFATVMTAFPGGCMATIGAGFAFGALSFFVAAAASVRAVSLVYRWGVWRAERRHGLGAPPKVFTKVEAKLDGTTSFGKAVSAVLAQSWLDGLGKADVRGVALYDRLSAMANDVDVSAGQRESAKRFIDLVSLTMSEHGWRVALDEKLAEKIIVAMTQFPEGERAAAGKVLAERLLKKRPKEVSYATWLRLEKALVGY